MNRRKFYFADYSVKETDRVAEDLQERRAVKDVLVFCEIANYSRAGVPPTLSSLRELSVVTMIECEEKKEGLRNACRASGIKLEFILERVSSIHDRNNRPHSNCELYTGAVVGKYRLHRDFDEPRWKLSYVDEVEE